MNAREELTKLLMESYDRGVNDAKQEALIALEKVVAVAIAAEREKLAKHFEQANQAGIHTDWVAAAIRARGQA